MKFLAAIVFVLSFEVKAGVIQVPDSCINKISPCLIRTEVDSFEFTQFESKIKLNSETIIKMTFDKVSTHIDLLDGRLSVLKPISNEHVIFVNKYELANENYLISKFSGETQILSLNTFVMTRFLASINNTKNNLLTVDFINKKDFINFTKNYFKNLNKYKIFLADNEKKWKIEFEKQNNSQTKVLARSIASIDAKNKIEMAKNKINATEQKKVKETFFYRTFNR